MATIRLKIEGEPGKIPLEAFLSAVEHELGMLQDLQHTISRGKLVLEWFISDMRIGSTLLDIVSAPIPDAHTDIDDAAKLGLLISKSLIESINSIELENKRPEYLSNKGMEHAKQFFKVRSKNKLSGRMILHDLDNSRQAEVTEAGLEHLEQFTSIISSSLGSIEGSLDAIKLQRHDELIKTKIVYIEDLFGLDPDFTGGLSSDAYIRRMRNA